MLWQSGYQRSGTKWLGALLTNLLCDDVPDSRAGYQASIPNWNDVADGKFAAPIGWVRTHSPFGSNAFDDVPYLAGVHIVRHPLDVLISSFAYRMSVDRTVVLDKYTDAQIRAFLVNFGGMFVSRCGDNSFNTLNASNWNQNVKSWIDETSALVIRCEDAADDPVAALVQIDQFLETLGIAMIKKRSFEEAADMAGFDRSEIIEDNQVPGKPPVPRPPGLYGSLIRRGGRRQWKEFLPADLIRQAEDTFGEVAIPLGYEF